ncbi:MULTISPECIES: RibD family protein [Pseudanabaena]|uniref:Bifunctional deaminase-reductase domain protein n=2 Tax=Pseudanabaena TaxID=1152 RepID=L8N7M1_9CYAN|nr:MULTISPECIES: RibD family protein [Pseudanabaena]ELS34233.1 bifunctional deaminase-reductase domain protein [Pseudanabaena biceps PCC 7429]MDG3493590.1 RibD family protein [Pseudanabaena catenata USMAC16]
MYNCLFSSHDRIYNFEELGFPTTGIAFDCENLGDRQQFLKRPYIVFNMVSSVDGKATTYAGQLTGLGSRPDRLLMKRLRSQFDAVLAGGTTLRHDAFIPTIPPELAEERQKNFPQPQPLGIVISTSGDLPSDHRFWDAGKDLRVVLTGEDTKIADWLTEKAQIFRFPTRDRQIDLKLGLSRLFEQLGVKRLLVEGGPSLNYSLVSQGLADELFLTLSPHLVGGVDNMTVLGGTGFGLGGSDLPKLKLRSLYHHDSELFLRYQLNLSSK